MATQKNHPHRDHAGFIYGGQHATAYVAAEQGCDESGGKYAVICEHSSVVNTTTKQDAILCARFPSNFCDECYKQNPNEPDVLKMQLREVN